MRPDSTPPQPAIPGATAAPTDNLIFQFHPRHRNIPNSELLADLRSVAHRLRLRTLTKELYDRHGQFKHLTFFRRFGSWNKALTAAGLQPSRNFRVTAEQVLTDIRNFAKMRRSNCLVEQEYLAAGKYSTSLIYRHFGTWKRAVETAGLTPAHHGPTTQQELFDNLEKVWRTLGRQPKSTEMHSPISRFTVSPYYYRFGGFQNALKAFLKSRNIKQPPRPAPTPTPIAITPTHKTPKTINWRLRFLTLRRDHFRCRACGRSPATDPNIRLQVDHIKPWSRGGETTLQNLQTLCQPCNNGKSNLPWKE